MDKRIQCLKDHGDQLFGQRQTLMSFWQETADNFYPEIADFTAIRTIGIDFAANLTTSWPILCRRELGSSIRTMLRPENQDWFHMGTSRDDRVDAVGKRWLQWATGIQRRAMKDRKACLDRATSLGDNDFAAFGQTVLSGELNRFNNTLLYRHWHLRDVAWCEGTDGQIGEVHRKWEPSALQLSKLFPEKISSTVKKMLDKQPYEKVKVRHIVIPSDDYEAPAGKKWRQPYVHVTFEIDKGNVLEEVGSYNPYYIIPRWQTFPGSQYAFSPAVIAALPDARLIQAMTLVLLEAGEKATNPPLAMKHDILRSDMNYFPGGITHVDLNDDEKIQDALMSLGADSRGIPLGMELRNDTKEMISQAFFLNKLNLPREEGGEAMTAFEAAQRMQEYIRGALPLFGPMEVEYNGALCDLTFNLLLRAGGFGSFDDIPQSLRRQEMQFRFESPLHELIEKQKGQQLIQSKTLIASVVDLDPSAAKIINTRTALRDALDATVPAGWIRSEQEMEQIDVQDAQRAQAQELISLANQGGQAAEQVGKAGIALNGMMAPPGQAAA